MRELVLARTALLLMVSVNILSACSSSNDAGPDSTQMNDNDAEAGDASDGVTDDAPALEVSTVSSRPDTVTGGQALLSITGVSDADVGGLAIIVNDSEIADPPIQATNDNALVVLVEALENGQNTVVVSAPGLQPITQVLVNHAITGPVISGPQQQPFFCQTDSFQIHPNGELLGQSLDANCSVETRIDYVYRTLSNEFLTLDPEMPLPEDAASVTTNDGATVPYVVRLETGTINRAIYQTAILDDPSVPGPSLMSRDPAWNDRLVYQFGGGCRGGWYRQGNSTGGVLDDKMLSQGFAVASASLNVFGYNCNDLLAAETMMMVKERFVEAYGQPRYTIGRGCSGGAYQLHQIADNYPGLLDGILPECSFPDVGFSTTHTLTDARLLENYFRNNAGLEWDNEQRRAVSGFGRVGSLANLANGAARIDPVPARDDGRSSAEFDAVVPEVARFDPVARSTGARATIYDHTINAYGRDPATGFARRPLDNVGIQYGLDVFLAGQISSEQFLDLNERIGGFDINASFTAERTEGDVQAIDNAYRTGRLLSGGGGLASIPILDYDYYYTDLEPGGDIHMKFQHFATRERLLKANGQIDNHIMWSGGGNLTELAENGQRYNTLQRLALKRMDEWLARISADTNPGTDLEKTVRNKPADLVDGCYAKGDSMEFIPEPQRFGGPGTSTCNDLYPAFPSPRQVAGGPLSNDVIKCQLKPVELDDYSIQLSSEQQVRLNRIFDTGVCDWTRDGVGQSPLDGTWLRFIDVGSYEMLGG